MTNDNNATLTEIARLEAELIAAHARLEVAAVTTNEIKVATAVHSVHCNANHADGCFWFYKEDDWTEWAHARYLKVAREMLKRANGEADLIVDLVTALNIK